MDNNAEKGDKWVYFKPLPVRKLIHELYNRVCEKEGQPHLSLDVLETLLIREGHGPVKDSFGRETERQYDFIEKINSVRLFITIRDGEVELSEFERIHNVLVDEDEIYELKRASCHGIPSKDAYEYIKAIIDPAHKYAMDRRSS